MSYRQVHAFIRVHLDRLNAVFGLSLRKAPAYTTVRFILRGLDAAQLEHVFRQHAAELSTSVAVEGAAPICVAIDGKTLRGSFDAFNDRKAAHVLSAFAADGQIILGHLAIAEKSNEISAAQDMIETLGLSGRLFTLDAMHTQKTFATALASGNHLLVQLKDNQPSLTDTVVTLITKAAPINTNSSCNNGRSRQESRIVDVFSIGEILVQTKWAKFIKTIMRVNRQSSDLTALRCHRHVGSA